MGKEAGPKPPTGLSKRMVHGVFGAVVGAALGGGAYLYGWAPGAPAVLIGGGALVVGGLAALMLDRFWDADRWWWT